VQVKGFLRAVGFFVASLIVGELVRRLLTSRVGESVAGKLGHPEIATHEGAGTASKEVKRVIGFVRSLVDNKELPISAPRLAPPPGWVGIARDASELLLATGAVLRTAADFANEDEQLRRKVGRRTGN
jgi:hypothetical protein